MNWNLRRNGAGQLRPYLESNEIRVLGDPTARPDQPLYVLLPGLGAEAEIWGPVMERLGRLGRPAVALEAPGFGYRDPAESVVVLTEAARAVLAADVLGPERPRIYVGHSAGFMLAIKMAEQDPCAVGLMAVNGVLDALSEFTDRPLRRGWRHPVKAYWLVGLLAYLLAPLPELVLRRLEQPGLWSWLFWPMVARPQNLTAADLRLLVRHNRCRVGWAVLRANRHYDLASQVGAVKLPLIVVAGRHDPMATRPERSRFLQGVANGYEVVEVDCGHCGTIEVPDKVALALARFGRELVMGHE